MEREVSVRELNQRTSAVLRAVAGGAAVTITSDGRPVARLVPVGSESSALAGLIATGRARPATVHGRVPMPPICGSELLDVAALMASDREDRLP